MPNKTSALESIECLQFKRHKFRSYWSAKDASMGKTVPVKKAIKLYGLAFPNFKINEFNADRL